MDDVEPVRERVPRDLAVIAGSDARLEHLQAAGLARATQEHVQEDVRVEKNAHEVTSDAWRGGPRTAHRADPAPRKSPAHWWRSR